MKKALARSAALALLAALIAAPVAAQTTTASAPVQRIERGNLILENVPATPEDVRERLVQYQNVRAAGFTGFLPDGGILITTRFGETPQLHEVKMPMGARSQLTYAAEPIAGSAIMPDGSGDILYLRDKGGNELFQAYRFSRTTGRSVAITEPGTRNAGPAFSKDGKTLAWSVTRPGKTEREIVMMTGGDPATRKVIATLNGAWNPIAFSPDGTKLTLGEYISVTDSNLYVMDLATGARTEILPGKTLALGGGVFSADGKSLFITSDEGSDFQRLIRIDIATGKQTVLTSGINWDVDGFVLSDDARTLAYVINADGMSELRLMNAETGAPLPGPKLPPGIIGGVEFDKEGKRLGFSFSSARGPGDVWVWDLAAQTLTQWTRSEIGGLNPSVFVDPELVRYPTFDMVDGKRRTIPAFVYRAKTTNGPAPVIIDIHGGPEGQSRPGFNSRIQYWVNEIGATVIVPNVRGSTGYGKTYVGLDNGYKREDSVKDIGALLDWVATQPGLDKDRVVVYGGSYGGYMVLASLTNYNDRLAGGINIVGISNFNTFLKNTEGYRVDLRRVEYGDERDPQMREFLEKISPLTNASKITKPLFVIQGLNDPRVPYTEAEQITAKVRANGGNVWFMMAKDEGHGFRKKSNVDAQREAETLWLREVFGNGAAR